MLAFIEHLLGPLMERVLGAAAMLGGFLLLIAFWFFDYAAADWRVRKGTSLLMWGLGALLIVVFFCIDWDDQALIGSVILGTLMYLPLRSWTRRSAWRRNGPRSCRQE
jgi:hypothetical protein